MNNDLHASETPSAPIAPPPLSVMAALGRIGLVSLVGLVAFGGLCLVAVLFGGRSDPQGAWTSRLRPTDTQLAALVGMANEPCPRTTRTFFQGRDVHTEVWTVACSTGRSYLISVEDPETTFAESGNARVIACDDLEAVALDCWTTLTTFDDFRPFDDVRLARGKK